MIFNTNQLVRLSPDIQVFCIKFYSILDFKDIESLVIFYGDDLIKTLSRKDIIKLLTNYNSFFILEINIKDFIEKNISEFDNFSFIIKSDVNNKCELLF
jgi:hypothetical protein